MGLQPPNPPLLMILCVVISSYSIILLLDCYHRNIKFKGPYTINSEQRTIHHTYLDTIGRPVVVVNKDNLVEQHIADFEVQWALH